MFISIWVWNESRKTYYKWENRALEALLSSLEERKTGRPELPDHLQNESELQNRIEELEKEKELLKKQMELKDLVHQLKLDEVREHNKPGSTGFKKKALKNERSVKLVNEIERVKGMFKVSYAMIFKAVPLCSTTYRRWKFRVQTGKDPVGKPGLKPLKPQDLQKLDGELGRLAHGPKRSRGISTLRGAMGDSISRRELDMMVVQARKNKLNKERAEQFKLQWHRSGAVWSMDVFEVRTQPSYCKHFVLSVQDLASGYKLPPLSSDSVPKGQDVTRHLGQLFKAFGKPLFLKRDNGGNLNHSSVTELLAENHVLPLNNPCHYAWYNGAIEHAQGEFKQRLRQKYNQAASLREFALSAELTAHDLNHVGRRKLQGKTSCSQFFRNRRFNYPDRKRQEVFLWINNRAVGIMEQAGKKVSQSSAWRIACKLWLMKNDLLSISKNNEVLPPLSGKTAHN